jgi:RNA ligase (TIGR02306 family)
MSSLIVEVCEVEEIAPIEGADRIERVRVKNWWCVSGKGTYSTGDKVVFVPPDAVISEELANRWGIAKYCPKLPQSMCGENEIKYRIKAARFRGTPSFGTIQSLDDQSWPVGHNVKEHYGITKYEPPVKALDGDAAAEIPAFHAYSSIENIGNFPNIFQEEEEVIVTEKIHGTNCRLGYVLAGQTPDGDQKWEIVAGSHSVRRKEFDAKGHRSKYWMPLKQDGSCPISNMLVQVFVAEKASRSVVLFGEIFGQGIQDMDYGQKTPSFRAFDLAVDGKYLDWDKTCEYLKRHDIPVVPLLYRGPFSMEVLDQHVDGQTTICDANNIKTPFKGREGIVIKPTQERYNDKLYGRTILKYVSADYHDRRNPNPSEDH